MNKTVKKILLTALYPILLVGFIGTVWYIAASVAGNEFILPTPKTTIKRFFEILSDGEFYLTLSSTLGRSFLAFLISLVGGLILAILSVIFPPLKNFLSPLVSVLRALPTMAVVLLLVIWAGATTAPIYVTIMVILPTLYSGLYDAIVGVDEQLVEACKVAGGDKKAIITKIYLPLALPSASRSISGALSLSIKLTVAAEVLSLTAGSIGTMMQMSRIYFETADLMALTVVTVIVSVALEKLLFLLLSLLYKR